MSNYFFLKLTEIECVISSPLAQVHFIECVPSLYRVVERANVEVDDALKAVKWLASSNV